MSAPEKPRLLVSFDQYLPYVSSAQTGALWKLAEERRQLDANLIRLPPDSGVAAHVENSLDVLLLVVAGDGRLDSDDEQLALAAGSVAWLPRSSRRALTAGAHGLVYLTVHARRPGLSIAGTAAVDPQEGGEAPCSLDRVCPECGTMRAESGAPFCAWCGERVSAASEA
ncbi:hypothetical protein [Streptomyces sp. NRRL B-1347]|uniref:hypothetical protein n=1 Tax=Streptomyces sp. NRRL B-1347 TaxID=1476877 RepID=UPI0004C7FFD5|nr:hypothetical protein [Streptomyces sp. NRRL B-1347]